MATKRRFSWGCWAGSASGLIAIGAGAWWFLAHRGGSDEKKDAEAAPTAQVQVAPLRRGQIERTLTAYGTAAAAPGGTRSVSFPFESRVVTVQANLGQSVAEGDALLQIEPSADTRLALDTARSAQTAAGSALNDVQARFKAHLATNADLSAAESAARDARLKFDSLQSRAPDAAGIVKAPGTGVVTKLPAGPGAVVPPGGPLAEIAVEKRFEARLGIAPADAGEVKPGQTVHLAPVEARISGAAAKGTLQGTVRVVGASVDPATRLVDAFVALDEPTKPVLIGTYLRAEIVVEKKEALLAPRAAVLPAEGDRGGRATLFTVQGDKARKHTITTGIDDGQSVEINGDGEGLAVGDNVVTQGNYELQDKMAVEIATPDATDTEKPGEDKTP